MLPKNTGPWLFWLLTSLAVFFILTPKVYAKALGTIGAIYPIAENDALALLQKRMTALEAQGSFIKLQAEVQRSVRQAMDRPAPVGGISPTLTPRTFLFDPTIEISHDITDENQQKLIPKGARLNPLDNATPFPPLLFYNADNPKQAAWALKTEKALQGKGVVILVGGSVFDQMKALGKPVYFDQGGLLTLHLGISHVPALVTQQGLRLRIQEALAE